MSPHRHGALRAALPLHAIAIATSAAAVAALAALPATAAPFYDQTGSVYTDPIDLFPIDVNTAVLNFGSNTLGVGNGAVGSFAALSGAQLTAAGLIIAQGGTGSGSVSVSGPATLVTLNGTASTRLAIADWGTGSLTVSGGAVLDAATNTAGCANCYSFVGNGAGSTGSLTITGAGSELRTGRGFEVGKASVFTLASSGFDFGMPGGTTNASVNVLAGGSLVTAGARVGIAPSGTPGETGSEHSFATVLVNGAGSRWAVGPNTVDNGAAGITIAAGARATGVVTVANGATLRIDGTGGPGPNDFVNIATGGGNGTLSIVGAGSSLVMVGVNPVLQVGRSGVGAVGSFNVLSGATASTLFVNVGRDAATGTVTIDGAGSRLSQFGVAFGNAGNSANAPAFANVGRDGGTGSVTVSNGGRWELGNAGGDTHATSSPGIILGRGIGSSGSLTISGSGSVVEIVSTSLGVPAGTADNFNPFVAVGNDNPLTTSGTLVVSGGGKLLMTGNAVSDATNARATNLNIGGRSTSSGTGSATVTGSGSEILLAGYDRFIGVGRGAGSTGTLSVLDQGRVSTTSLLVGECGSGTLSIDNATVALDGYRTDSTNAGAGSTIGRGSGGSGTLAMGNGASFSINASVLAGGMSIGGDQFVSGGTGTVTLSGGSSLTVGGPVAGGSVAIGRSGTGSMTLTGASTLDVGNTRTVFVGREVGGNGTLSVAGGSLVSGNFIHIGGNSDTVQGGTGAATVNGSGSVLRATGGDGFIGVGRFNSSGSLSVLAGGRMEAIVLNVGRAAGGNGTLLVDGGTLQLAGEQTNGSTPVGAAMTVGNRGGTGTATITNGSTVTVTNGSSKGAAFNVGGTPVNPLGTGTVTVSNGSSVTVAAAAGLGIARIGWDGNGSATFSGGSSLSVVGGSVLVGGLAGGVGLLDVNSGSSVSASYVGIGSSAAGNTGTASLRLDASTLTAQTVEIGSLGTLSGSGGTIVGSVVNRGTISPGNSPGRVTINGGISNGSGSTLMLDVQDTGTGFAVDNIVLTDGSSFSFGNVQVVFNFLGNTDPNAFGASGQFDLDTFLLSQTAGGTESGLSSTFTAGQTWNTVLAGASFAAMSPVYSVTQLTLNLNGSGNFQVVAVPVPEPATYALWLLGLGAAGWRLRRRIMPRAPGWRNRHTQRT